VQTATSMPKSSRLPDVPDRQLATRAERLIAFRQAIASGCTIVEASRAAGISERTAARWKAALEGEVVNIKDALSAIAHKSEAATILTAIARNENENAAYRVAALDKLGRFMGYEAAVRTEQIVVNATVQQWIDSLRIAATASKTAEVDVTPLIGTSDPDTK
jgi:hypothetical protein